LSSLVPYGGNQCWVLTRNRNKLLVAIRGVRRVHNCGSHGIAELVSDIVIEVPKKLKSSNNRRYSCWLVLYWLFHENHCFFEVFENNWNE